MALTFNQVANIIIEGSNTKTPSQEDPDSVDAKSRNLIFALQNHQEVFNPNKLALSLIADLMGIDYYTEENAEKLTGIIKTKLSASRLKPAT